MVPLAKVFEIHTAMGLFGLNEILRGVHCFEILLRLHFKWPLLGVSVNYKVKKKVIIILIPKN